MKICYKGGFETIKVGDLILQRDVPVEVDDELGERLIQKRTVEIVKVEETDDKKENRK